MRESDPVNDDAVLLAVADPDVSAWIFKAADSLIVISTTSHSGISKCYVPDKLPL